MRVTPIIIIVIFVENDTVTRYVPHTMAIYTYTIESEKSAKAPVARHARAKTQAKRRECARSRKSGRERT